MRQIRHSVRAFFSSLLSDPVPVHGILLALIPVIVFTAFAYSRRFPQADFYRIWVVAGVLPAAPSVDFYGPEFDQKLSALTVRVLQGETSSPRLRSLADQPLDILQTPFLYTVVRAFSTGDYDRDSGAFTAVALLLFLLAVVLLGRCLNFPPLLTAALIVCFFGRYAPLNADVRLGNIAQIQLGLVALYFWAARKGDFAGSFLGGVVLGLDLLIKPILAGAVLLLLASVAARREGKKLASVFLGLAAAGAVGAAATYAFFGSLVPWAHWLAKVRAVPPQWVAVEFMNYSLSALLHAMWGFPYGKWLGAVLAGVALWGVVRSGSRNTFHRPEERMAHEMTAFWLGMAVLFLAAQWAWIHYFIYNVVAIVVALRPVPADDKTFAVRIRRAAGLILLFIMGIIEPIVPLFGEPTTYLAAGLSSLAHLCAFTVFVTEAWRQGARPSRGPAAA